MRGSLAHVFTTGSTNPSPSWAVLMTNWLWTFWLWTLRHLAIAIVRAAAFPRNPAIPMCRGEGPLSYPKRRSNPSSAEEGRTRRDHQSAGARIGQLVDGDCPVDDHEPSRRRRTLRRRPLRDEPREFGPDGKRSHPAQPRPSGNDVPRAVAVSAT